VYSVVTRPFVWNLLITVALAAAPADLAAQSLVCQTIRPGESASSVALRLTGRADSRRQPWFRIVDRNRRVIPKARYHRVLAGWYACVPTARLTITRADIPRRAAQPPVVVARFPLTVEHAPVTDAPAAAATPRVMQQQPMPVAPATRDLAAEFALLCLGAAAFGTVIGFGWQSVEQFLARRETVIREMEGFGYMFLKDFARSLLVEGVITHPIRARLRCAPRDRRLDILVAPAAGRRYPNLDDHRKNVEYDVDRVTQGLGQHAFVRSPLRAEGAWVVIPFRFEPSAKTGAVV
jgi:hypothetical protein